MNYKEFVKSTVITLRPDVYKQIRTMLIPEYLSFSFIPENRIPMLLFAEKLCDFFDKSMLRTGKNFSKAVDSYFKDLDSIVEKRIEKTPQPKKNDPEPVSIPRARKYYEKAVSLKKAEDLSTEQLEDYTRIMLCLYTAIIKNGFKEISNFDFSSDCINVPDIISAMKKEEEPVAIKIGKKLKFDTRDRYGSDMCTLILTIISLAYHSFMMLRKGVNSSSPVPVSTLSFRAIRRVSHLRMSSMYVPTCR